MAALLQLSDAQMAGGRAEDRAERAARHAEGLRVQLEQVSGGFSSWLQTATFSGRGEETWRPTMASYGILMQPRFGEHVQSNQMRNAEGLRAQLEQVTSDGHV